MHVMDKALEPQLVKLDSPLRHQKGSQASADNGSPQLVKLDSPLRHRVNSLRKSPLLKTCPCLSQFMPGFPLVHSGPANIPTGIPQYVLPEKDRQDAP